MRKIFGSTRLPIERTGRVVRGRPTSRPRFLHRSFYLDSIGWPVNFRVDNSCPLGPQGLRDLSSALDYFFGDLPVSELQPYTSGISHSSSHSPLSLQSGTRSRSPRPSFRFSFLLGTKPTVSWSSNSFSGLWWVTLDKTGSRVCVSLEGLPHVWGWGGPVRPPSTPYCDSLSWNVNRMGFPINRLFH